MKIAFGCDHAGFELKDAVITHLRELGHTVTDCGTDSPASCDYPVFGERAARRVASGECELGILICGTGYGISVAANRVRGARAVCCSDTFTAKLSRRHNNANMLAFGARVVGKGLALELVDAFITSSFEGARHERRLKLIDEIQP